MSNLINNDSNNLNNLDNLNNSNELTNKNKTFVKDQFYVDGIISCKFISSVFSDEYKKKTGTEKLKFVLANDTINDTIINQLKNKELFFLKKTMDVAGNVRFPIQVKSFLKNSDVAIIFEVKNNPDSQPLIKKSFIQTGNNDTKGLKDLKQETSVYVSDKVNDISLKVKFNMDEKIIKYNKGIKSKISLLDLMEINKSENLKINVRIQCGAVFADNVLHISGTLLKINLEESKIAEVYEEIKEIKEKSEKKTNILLRDNLFISNYPTKSSTITNNIVNIMSKKK